MYKLKLSDGVNIFNAVEFTKFKQSFNIKLGQKYILKPNITIRRGIALLNETNLQYLCDGILQNFENMVLEDSEVLDPTLE